MILLVDSRRWAGLSTSPFRKLRIAESEYGLQNFTESGYGFRIYGIEVDMYRISRGIIFRFFLEIADSTLTDSTDSRIPCGFRQKRSATLPRPGPPAAPLPPRVRGIPLGLEPPPRRGTGQQSLPLAHFTGGQRAKQLLEERPSWHKITLGLFAHTTTT